MASDKQKPTMKPVELKDGASADIVHENVQQLKELFPEAFTEDGVDFSTLRQLLGGLKVLDEGEEKYGLNWHGKKQARQIALDPSLGTLLPCPEESADWDTTQNLFIEGDNLEVLKLLRKSYANEVKVIYIDPPYNTGKEFVYPDRFQDNLDTYLKYTGQIDNEGMKFSSNTESSGRKHTNWLNMMYPRLKLARALLKNDGAIFVSCDENEHKRLGALMDEIFGQENFVADMVWAAGRKNDSRLVSISHEYIICYAKDAQNLSEKKIEWRQRKKGLDEIYAQYEQLKKTHGTDYPAMTAEMGDWYKNLKDEHPSKNHRHYRHIDERGIYFASDISWPGGGGPKYEVLHPVTGKPVKIPSRGWMTNDPEKMSEWVKDNRVHFGATEDAVPCIKSYLKDKEYSAPYSVFYQDGRAATKRLRSLMGCDCFDFPKDETVLRELIEMLTDNDDIVMDFFAGSATAGHAVMEQNAADNSKRIFVLVQLPEPLDIAKKEQEGAAKFCEKLAVPHNIAELAKERIRRAAQKIKDENPDYKGDLGFKVFKLASSNIKVWNPDPGDLENSLLEHEQHLIEGRSEQDVLYELLLKRGVKLTVPIETRTIASKNVHSIGYGKIITCLDDSIGADDVESLAGGIVDWRKELMNTLEIVTLETHVFFKDSAFSDDVAKTNIAAILNQNGIGHVRSL